MKMKLPFFLKTVFLLSFIAPCFFYYGCGSSNNQQQGVVYEPQSKSNPLTDEQRQSAIARQKASLNGYMDSVSYSNAVKLYQL